jgi:hypothetical protein
MNFVAASDRPFAMSREDKRRNLLKFQQKGRPVFEGEAADVLEELLNVDTSDRARAIRHNPGLWYITDDNMAVEFKTNGPGLWWRSLVKRVYRPERAWSQVLF